MVDTQSAYDGLHAWDMTTEQEYILQTISWIVFIWRIIQDRIVNWNRYKQSKAKWRAGWDSDHSITKYTDYTNW